MPKVNYASGATGALSGAASGAAIGSAVPGIGTAIGAGVGGLIGGVSGLFGNRKKKKKPKKYDTLDANQKALYGDLTNSLRGNGPFSDLYNYDTAGANANFDQNVSRPAYRNFNENIIPGITGQFRQGNIGNSSYTGEALGRAGRNVQENLDAQRSNMIFNGQQQANTNKMNGINSILGMQTFAYGRPEERTPSGIDQVLGQLGPIAGDYVRDYLKDARKSSNPSSTPSFPSGGISSGSTQLAF